MSDLSKGNTSPGSPFLECVPENLVIEGGATVALDPDHRRAIADDLGIKARILYGGSPVEIRAALWNAMECAERRISRRTLLQALEGFSPALFAGDFRQLTARLGELVPGLLCEAAGDLDAAGLNNDAAELMALAAVSIAESVRANCDVLSAWQEGRPSPKVETPYADVLVEILAKRRVLPSAEVNHASA